MTWKVIDSKINQHGRNVYACQDCPNKYFEVYIIYNWKTGQQKKLCEGCLEPYFNPRGEKTI